MTPSYWWFIWHVQVRNTNAKIPEILWEAAVKTDVLQSTAVPVSWIQSTCTTANCFLPTVHWLVCSCESGQTTQLFNWYAMDLLSKLQVWNPGVATAILCYIVVIYIYSWPPLLFCWLLITDWEVSGSSPATTIPYVKQQEVAGGGWCLVLVSTFGKVLACI